MGKQVPALLKWEGDLTLARAAELKAALLELLSGVDRAEIDLSAAGVAEGAGLQLLCAAHKEAVALGKTISLSGRPPRTLEESAEAAGFLRDGGCAPGCLWVWGVEGERES
jgi:anti-anti-sigma regulatory factor